MDNKIQEFLTSFGLKPKNFNLYLEALTHNSYANEHNLKYTYQRLEFLGDSILEMYSSIFLYENYPNIKEGQLTKIRSNVVREESLAYISKEIGLSKIIRFGQGEIKDKGYKKNSILADVFEALTAAIYLDLGESYLKIWFDKTIINFFYKPGFLDRIKDYKSELQELLQYEGKKNLKYIVEKEDLISSSNKIFYTIGLYSDGKKFGVGQGYSKQEAEQNAAKDSLSKMKNN